jgi:hypothetical protein
MQPQDPNQPNQQPQQPQPEAQQMYYQRPHEPQAPVISDEIKRRHEECLKKYPGLNLSKGEFIISDVHRHPIGLLSIWVIVMMVVAAIMTLLVLVMSSTQGTATTTIPPVVLGSAALLLCSLALIFGYVGTYVYRANRFYLTNESVIQVIQTSLFSRREQTVSLNNIEDASFTKRGIIQHLFDYGQIRLSTEGDETTYRFQYAASPSKQVAVLNNAVEAFKNGRPVIND